MSSTLPPPPPPEFLESGGGAPVPREPGQGGSAVRKGLFVGGGVVGLVAVGVGAWAAYSFMATGPQPAQALPATTLGYASIDLDPSGGQKIEALRTLNKFPAFKDLVGVNPDDDLREKLLDTIKDQTGCDDLDYADDVEPWLGERAAVAAVDLGGDTPEPVVVLQVTDADKAKAGIHKLQDCLGSSEGDFAVEGDWAMITSTDGVADKIAAAAEKGSLADDSDFKKWTDEAGDSGVATFYAAPAAGDYLADHGDSMLGFPLSLAGATSSCAAESEDGGIDESCSLPGGGVGSDELKQKFRDFKGMAATVRFDDGAIELEVAGDATLGGEAFLTGGGTADVVTSLPADTGAVLGLGFEKGWFGNVIEQFAPYADMDPDELESKLSDMTGLELPADAETLAGDSAALVLGSSFDPETFFSSDDGSDIPIALKIQGDPDEIEKVLDKLRDSAGPAANVLESDANGETVVIGPNPDFRAEVAKDGELGDNDVFKDVVGDTDDAQTVLFVNVDEFEDAIASAMGGSDDEFFDNLKPIAGFGVIQWRDGDTTHAVFRVATD